MKRIFLVLLALVTFFFNPVMVYGQRPPVKAIFTESPSIGCELNHTVFFTDLSENPDIWLWNFGDGSTSTSQNPIHTFTSAGSFNVSLFVQDTINGDSDEISRIITIGVSTVDFNASATFGCGPLTTNFTDLSSINGEGSIVSWLWTFGNGATSSDQNPSYIYDNPGTYTVSLTTTSSLGCTKTRTKTNFIQVIGPDVEFTATHTGNDYTFTNATISGSPVISRLWTFGDGTTSTDLNPTHTYTAAGVYDVSLTVNDLDGCLRTLTKTNFVNTIAGAFDVSQAIFTGDHERFSLGAVIPRSMAFNTDGSKMFVLNANDDSINEYDLSSAYDISTAVFAGDSERFSVAAQETSPRSVAFSTDGTKMFVMGFNGDDINEYHLATAFDISTASYAGNSERFSVAAQETHPNSLTFNEDGTKMYVTGSDDDEINQYTLSAAFDVSTAVYQTTLSVSAQELFPQSIAFVDNGSKLLVMGSSGDDINEYNLTTAFDISTASYAGDAERLSVAGQDTQPNSFAFNASGTQLFVAGVVGQDINVYSLASPVIIGATANQAVNDNATLNPFSTITVQDPNSDNVSATITLDDNAKGVLTGAGLSGTGPYTLASTDAASLQAGLRTLVFSPTENRAPISETTTFTLEVSDGSFSDADDITTVVSSAVAPSVIISSVATDPINGSFTAAFTFSEDVTGFEIGDITVGNGAASDFIEINASEYSALITPTADGTVTIDIAEDVAQDGGGMNNTAPIQFSIEADLTLPTVVITSPAPDPTNEAFTITFTFSENVTGFEIADITVGNGTTSDFASTSASVYTALITPTADGTVTINVAADVALDEASNGNTIATQFSIAADLTAPTVSITSTASDPTNAAFTVTFTFSENVAGFEIADITVGNGTTSDFASTSASVYTALITPTTDGTVTIDVAADVAQDLATNGNIVTSQFSIEADLTTPSVSITSAAADPTNGAFIATFTFSEDVMDFEVDDISVGNGTAESFASTSASVYTAEIIPTADGMVTVYVSSDVAKDVATNGNTAATQFSIEADLTAPTLSITSAAVGPTNEAFTAVFTFSENVTGFEIGDISVGNGTASDFALTSASIYTVLITPITNGIVTIDVAANVAQDAATNENTAATKFSIEADLTDPTVSITSAATDPTNAAFTAIFTFSENVTGFEIGDISVGNGTASDFALNSASIYTVLITPITDGIVTIDVAANVAQDAATNGNTTTTQFSIETDLTTPILYITSAAADPINGAFTTAFTFSEAVSGFELGDITVSNGMATDFTVTNTSEYTALITPTANGTVTVNVPANVVQDAATNGNTAPSQFSLEADLTTPILYITSAATDPTNEAFTATFTFSEGVTGFETNDISVGNGTASDFTVTNTSEYTALITPTANGTVTVNVPANVVQDEATNGNTAPSQFSLEADLTAPTLSITSAATDPTNEAFTATFTFSEGVTGFETNDISVGNGTVSNFTEISVSEYTTLITPTSDGTVTIDVASNVVKDAATNGNTAAAQFSIDYDGSVTEVFCQDITIQLDANGDATIEASQIDNGSSDIYGIASMALDITTFDCSNIGNNEVILTVTDVNGNTGSCVAVVTVEDTSPPIVVVQDITLPLNTNGQASITVDDIDNGSTDNCGIVSRNLDVSTFDTPTTPSTTVTLTVIDHSGNVASNTATITFGKVSQSILFKPLPDKKVGEDPIKLEATGGGSGLPITFSIKTEPSSGVATLINNQIIIEGTGIVTITANQDGNDVFEAASSVSQSFEIQSNELFLPTLFSPNNDQVNDRFIIRGGGNISTIELTIFDRNNNIVFRSNSLIDLFQSGWDGADQPQNVYIWTVKGSFSNGTPLLINGSNKGLIRLTR